MSDSAGAAASPFGNSGYPPVAEPVGSAAPAGPRQIVRPSFLPVAVAGLLLALSLAVYFLFASDVWAAWLGYALTPFAVVAVLVWARLGHLRKCADIWYDRFGGLRLLRILQLITLASFVVAALHIWRIATELAAQ